MFDSFHPGQKIHGFLASLRNRLLKLPYLCPFSSMHTVLKNHIQLLLLIVNPRYPATKCCVSAGLLKPYYIYGKKQATIELQDWGSPTDQYVCVSKSGTPKYPSVYEIWPFGEFLKKSPFSDTAPFLLWFLPVLAIPFIQHHPTSNAAPQPPAPSCLKLKRKICNQNGAADARSASSSRRIPRLLATKAPLSVLLERR